MNVALILFATIWIVLALLVSTVATINLFITSNPLEVDPVNVTAMWLLFEAVLFSPAVGALYWRRRRRRARLAS